MLPTAGIWLFSIVGTVCCFLKDQKRQRRALPFVRSVVNENGASIYSVTDEAKSELPDLDPNLRSAVSIARRLQDPLVELVKIDPKHIGVGMYQVSDDFHRTVERKSESKWTEATFVFVFHKISLKKTVDFGVVARFAITFLRLMVVPVVQPVLKMVVPVVQPVVKIVVRVVQPLLKIVVSVVQPLLKLVVRVMQPLLKMVVPVVEPLLNWAK